MCQCLRLRASTVMNSDSLAKCGRYFLLITNVIFEFLGGFALTFGIIVLATSTNGNNTIEQIDLIVGGIVLIGVSVLGYYAAYKEKVKPLKIYAIILIIIVAFKTFFYGLALCIRQKAEFSPEEIRSWFDQYGQNSTSTAIVDELQKTLRCCGYTGPESMIFSNRTYPSSCCINILHINPNNQCYVPYISGCEPQLVPSSPVGFSVIFFISLILQILCIVAAFHLAAHIQKKTRGETVPFNNL